MSHPEEKKKYALRDEKHNYSIRKDIKMGENKERKERKRQVNNI